MNRLMTHVRSNAIAYVALFFAIGGGGAGAAIAATAVGSSTIHACVSKKTGAVYIAKRCGSTTKALTLDQRGPAGTSAVVAFGSVDPLGQAAVQQGMTITQVATGVYNVVVPACLGKESVPVATPEGQYYPPNATAAAVPVVSVAGSQDTGVSFVIDAGNLENGTYVPSDQAFDVQDQC